MRLLLELADLLLCLPTNLLKTGACRLCLKEDEEKKNDVGDFFVLFCFKSVWWLLSELS